MSPYRTAAARALPAEEHEPIVLDFSNEALTPPALSDAYRPPAPKDPWLDRRGATIGGSEIGALLTAYGLAPLDAILPTWLLEENVAHYQRLGIPKMLAQKAGLRGRPKGDQKTKDAGNALERELLARYKATIARHRVDPKTIRHADTIPKQWFPLVDRYCSALAVTPDAWARALDGELCMLEIKCTFKPLAIVRAPWHYRCQLQAEMAVCGAKYGILVMGEEWISDVAASATWTPKRGPIRAFAFERDEAMISLIRTVATEAWGVVESLRNIALEFDAIGDSQTKKAREARKAAAGRCAEVWSESRARMQAFAPASTRRIEDALSVLGDLEEYAA